MRILHVLRAPIGGLFRHVCDLVKGQNALGHEVGIVCDLTVGGANAEAALAKIGALCALGVHRLPITTKPSLSDFSNIRKTKKLAREIKVDVLHGHGAKGGLYARLAAKSARLGAFYTPHGGSLHYNWDTPSGAVYLATEIWLRRKTAGLAFVCDYERRAYEQRVGISTVPINVVHNGLWKEEFHSTPPAADAADILFVGEMADIKGVDIILRAIAELRPKFRLTAAMVGDGPKLADLQTLASELRLESQVSFKGRLSMAKALPLGKLFVMASRNESFPYVVLEAIAADRQIISSNVGGLREALPDHLLYPAGSVSALAKKLQDVLENPHQYQAIADTLNAKAPKQFSAETMVQKITDFYTKST